MGGQEQSHRDEMNAAIRAQRERQAAVRIPEPDHTAAKASRAARIVARLRRK